MAKLTSEEFADLLDRVQPTGFEREGVKVAEWVSQSDGLAWSFTAGVAEDGTHEFATFTEREGRRFVIYDLGPDDA